MHIVFNLESVFQGYCTKDALTALREHGFDTCERWMILSRDVPAFKQAMKETGTCIKACCPDFFTLNDPKAHPEYVKHMKRAIATIGDLGGDQLITQVGADTGAERARQHRAIVEGLNHIKGLLEQAGITLLVEPLNTVKDHPGYYLTSSEEGFDIIREVNSPNVKLLYDVYHQLHMGEDVLTVIAKNHSLIGHYHIAGFPARDERIFEGFDYTPVFELLETCANKTPVGIELFPSSKAAIAPLLGALAPYSKLTS